MTESPQDPQAQPQEAAPAGVSEKRKQITMVIFVIVVIGAAVAIFLGKKKNDELDPSRLGPPIKAKVAPAPAQ